VDIFEHATVEQLGRIAGLMEEVNFEAGETIHKRRRAWRRLLSALKWSGVY